jgi:hypothetical protein
VIIQVMPDMIRLANEVDTTNDLVNLDALNAILAFVSATFIIPLIQRPSFSTKVRAAITFVYSIILGVITTWAAGDLDLANVAQSIVTVFTVAIVTYHGFAQPTKIAPAIENATSPGSARKQPLDDPPAGG